MLPTAHPRSTSIVVYLLLLGLIVLNSLSFHYFSSFRGISELEEEPVPIELTRREIEPTVPQVKLRAEVNRILDELAFKEGWRFQPENTSTSRQPVQRSGWGKQAQPGGSERNFLLNPEVTLEELSNFTERLGKNLDFGVGITDLCWLQVGDNLIMQAQIGTSNPEMILVEVRLVVPNNQNRQKTGGSFSAFREWLINYQLINRQLFSNNRPLPLQTDLVEKRLERARVALIIDDIGFVGKPAEDYFLLQEPITFAVLPEGKFSACHAEAALKRGQEVILHLPLEPLDESINSGPGLISSRMTPRQALQQLQVNLRSIPGIIGVNNHMGSKATQDPVMMSLIMKELKDKGLFFVDSKTVAQSVAVELALKTGVPAVRRDVFIDHYGVEGIKEQMEILLEKAIKNGSAIGIAHARPGVAEAIALYLPEFSQAGVEIVPVSKLLAPPCPGGR